MRRILLAGCAVLLAACASTAGPQTPSDDLGSARETWAATGLHSYRFIFENDCGECLPSMGEPREVVVRAGATASPDDPTVETLFAAIEEAIAAGSSVEVSYHPVLGHPTEMWIDREARAYDGGTHWLIRDLRP